jgi:3-phosphoshikimate 1-carboxyvinyltransferase
MRFVPVIAAFFDGEVLIDGDPESYVRPMKPLIDGLRSLGIKVDDEKNPGYLPFKVYGNPNLLANTHQKVSIDSSSSSQFVSAFLLASPLFTNGLTVKLAPPAGSTDGALKVPSLPHIEMSVAAIAKFGVETEFINTEKNIEWTTKISNNKTANTAENPAEINAPSNKQTSNLNTAKQLTIEPDLSNAGVFMASVLANPLGGQITIKNWPADSIQPGAMMREIIEIIGADCGTVVAHNPETLDLTVVSNGLFSLDNFNATDWQHLNLSLAGELTPVIAALIALRVYITSYKTKDQITAKITGIAHLRGHETDRIKALVTELNKVFEPVENTGVQVISSELADGIQICGKFVPEKDGSSTLETVPDEKNSAQTVPDEKKSAQPVPNKIEKNVPNKILVDTYKDHRMVMFAAVLGLAIPEITKYQSEILIENVGTVAKTLPDFTSMWEKLISK